MTPYKPFVLDAIGEVDSRSEKTIDTLRPSHGSRLWGASLSAANCVLTSFANGDSAHYPVTPSPAGPYDMTVRARFRLSRDRFSSCLKYGLSRVQRV